MTARGEDIPGSRGEVKRKGAESLHQKKGESNKRMRTSEPANTSAPSSTVIAAVDGSCLGNPGPGGWAVVMQQPGQEAREWSGSCRGNTTNNRMELEAALSAVRAGNALRLQTGEMSIFTDSEYVCRGITEWISGWKRRGWRTASGAAVKNADLWRMLDAEASRLSPQWLWVRAHCASTPQLHQRADELARATARGAEVPSTPLESAPHPN